MFKLKFTKNKHTFISTFLITGRFVKFYSAMFNYCIQFYYFAQTLHYHVSSIGTISLLELLVELHHSEIRRLRSCSFLPLWFLWLMLREKRIKLQAFWVVRLFIVHVFSKSAKPQYQVRIWSPIRFFMRLFFAMRPAVSPLRGWLFLCLYCTKRFMEIRIITCCAIILCILSMQRTRIGPVLD